ncbi:HAD family hydrolase [Actinomycetospora cinnamomea]|uniref:HAD superfamily hydrolase (TIGR01509 family)/HAD superfamily hydrolase (TIGR01549 family) n=1 Tax=Actinomycetospora cinnamomea TaxID=663609 RepID=A0A2U1FHP7_9PSEU|nr:HAD family hydrolase [Actinomycetospora cinnamomea]PVZ11714.1 HAD superfamily hydrolase (TIGR01509 family)/HAD superfamily hydrolase (TIGR01549 family) [Actinomycetospora cinnamomea]
MTGTVILDVDGTLVDTNYHHALAWYRAFRRYDVTIPVWTIHRHIGMGGDQLVGAVAGEDVDARHGDDIRAAWTEEADAMLDEISALPGAHALLEAVKDAGFTLVMASSGKPHHVERYAELIEAGELADAWVSSGDVEQTKPAPDLLQVAMERVGAEAAVVVGDSVWDCRAAARLGLPSVAVRTGGFSNEELREAGATSVYSSVDELTADVPSLKPQEPQA